MPCRGVLLTAFGGPADLDAVEPFMRSVMRREPTPEQLEATREKYAAIGGGSPLPATAERIARGLETALGIPVAVGMLHSAPTVASGVAGLAARGVDDLVWASLSPFDAAVTVGAYRTAVEAAAREAAMSATQAAPYHLREPFVGFFADALTASLGTRTARGGEPLVVFSAHSLPLADVSADASYVRQLQATVVAVARRAGLGDPGATPELGGIAAFGGGAAGAPWLLAFQSKGARGGEWLGPELGDVIDAAAPRFGGVLVCPVGFALDHMETRYDIDVVAARRARDAGLSFARTALPNDDPRMIEALADSVREVI